MRSHRSQTRPRPGPPSSALLRQIEKFSTEYPVLDAGCGTGRNAIALARAGHSVICADRDETALSYLRAFAQEHDGVLRLHPVCAELHADCWPFRQNCFGTIVCVHFIELAFLEAARSSLVTGGHLYVETIGGQGGNHVDLPVIGTLRRFLENHYELLYYEERPAGPPTVQKCAAKLLARHVK